MAGLPPEASYEVKSVVLPEHENAGDSMTTAYQASSEAEEYQIITNPEGGRRRAWEDAEQEGSEHHDLDSSSSSDYEDAGAGGEDEEDSNGKSVKLLNQLADQLAAGQLAAITACESKDEQPQSLDNVIRTDEEDSDDGFLKLPDQSAHVIHTDEEDSDDGFLKLPDQSAHVIHTDEEESDDDLLKLPDQSAHVYESIDEKPQLLKKGLKLHVKHKTHAFTCALLTVKQGPISVDPLFPLYREQNHIRVHEVKRGENLSELLLEFTWSHASAVVLINIYDGYELLDEFAGEIKGALPIPVVIVSHEDGKAILKFMNEDTCPQLRFSAGTGTHDSRITRKGIELKHVYQNRVRKSYDCAHFLAMQQWPTMDWQPVVSMHNIYVHELRRGEELPVNFANLNTKAVVFINNRNNYSPSYRRAASLRNTTFPVVLLKLRDGDKIVTRLQQDHKMNTGISIDEGEKEPTLPQDYSYFEDLKHLAKKDSSSIPDTSTFQRVMAAFNEYETNKKKLSGINSKVIRRFKERFTSTRNFDLTFYILLAYRFHINEKLYVRDGAEFVETLIDYVEQEMEPDDMAQSILSSIQRGDFTAMFGEKISVFKLMDTACTTLAQVSYLSHNKSVKDSPLPNGHRRLYENFVFTRMLWTTVALKFRQCCSRNLDKQEPRELWTDLLNYRDRIVFSDGVLKELVKGLRFGVLIQLSPKYTLDSQCFAELFARHSNVRPFCQLTKYLRNVHSYLVPADQVIVMLSCIRLEYFDHFGKPGTGKLASLSTKYEVDLTGCLIEGIDFLHEMVRTLKYREVTDKVVYRHVELWLKELLKLVDIKSADSEKHLLKLFIGASSDSEIQSKVQQHVVATTRSSLHELQVKKFLKIYKTFDLPISMLQEFLERRSISDNVSLLTWKEFLSEVVSNFENAHHHYYLLNFLTKAAEAYKQSSRAVKYILDLMQLNVPKLLSEGSEEDVEVRKAFSNFLEDFISRNKLIIDMSQILEVTSTENDQFQLLIVDILCNKVVPFEAIAVMEDSLLIKSVVYLEENFEWRSYPSCKHRLCWRILTTFCSTVVPSKENFEWAKKYDTCLGNVFLQYCSQKKLPDDQCIVTESFLDGIKRSSPAAIHEYFKWIQDIQDALKALSVKFHSGDINYYEIYTYAYHYLVLHKVDKNVRASSLLPADAYAKDLTTQFSEKYQSLNVHLLLYIPDQPEAKWCSLIDILRSYGVSFNGVDIERLGNSIRFPNQSSNATQDENFVSLQLDSQFKHGHLTLHRDITLRQLSDIVEEISAFKNPLKESLIEMLVFFKLKLSVLFDVHLRLKVEKNFKFGNEVRNFADAVQDTYYLFDKIVKGDALYDEINENRALQLEELDVAREFSILSEYFDLYHEVSNDRGLKTIQRKLELLQFSTVIGSINSACQYYELKNCLEDPLLEELSMIMEECTSNWSTIPHEDVVEKLKKVKKILHLKDNQSAKDLTVFIAVIDSDDLFHFLQEKQFCDQQGRDIFFKQLQLIRAQLEHEAYNEHVLSHLFAAFQLISPFMDTDINFKELMKELKDLNIVNASQFFDTVKLNIALIRLWFSRAEGDTVENISKELECITTSGKYTFSKEDTGLVMQLKYKLDTLVPTSSNDNKRSECTECWNLEQIGDFVRKLGFLDKDEEKDDIKNFLRLNQTVHKIFGLYLKLGEQGHPNYMFSVTLPEIPCNTPEMADNLLQDTQQADTKWSHRINELRDEYKWLVFFSIPRVLQLADVLKREQINVIVNEVSFLANNQPSVRDTLRQNIKHTLELVRDSNDDSHMVQVGKFLDTLLKGHTLPDRCLSKQDFSSIPRSPEHITSYFDKPLYSCINWSQMDLQCLILRIFNGIPWSYQILHCRAATTEEELNLFLKRTEKHCSQYVMLDINKLPLKLQEHLVQQHLTSYQQLDRSGQNLSTVHYVESGPSIMSEIPGIVSLNDLKTFTISPDQAAASCKQLYLQSNNFNCFEIVYGSPGVGKTHYIRKQLSDCIDCEVLTIAVNEVFSPLHAIKKFRSLSLCQKNVGLFFNFTIFPPEDSVPACEKSRYHDMMANIGWFFFDLFVLGYVEDHKSGLSFRLPGGMQWSVYVEVPYRYGFEDNIQEVLNQFFLEIPTSKLLGTLHCVNASVPFLVDGDVQLVCKYLRAYKSRDNLITGIDRMYKDRGKQKGKLVKFSQDKDLPGVECNELLNEFMPQHVLQSKITQHLFIRYMKQRCDFLDNLPFFNFNQGEGYEGSRTNTKCLGSTLMQTMLHEVISFCDPNSKENWTEKTHQQLIYDFKDKSTSLGYISRKPNELKEEVRTRLEEIGVEIPQITDLYNRCFLDKYLSRALNVEMEDGRIPVLDDSAYVLTLDYAIKMLNIHERFKCGVPVIIEGETGVGKTALVEMLSKLWNQSLLLQWRKEKAVIIQSLLKKLNDYEDIPKVCLQTLKAVYPDEVNLQSLLLLCNYNDSYLCKMINECLSTLRVKPILSLLACKMSPCTFEKLFSDAEKGPEHTAYLLQAILLAEVDSTFHKINVHAALTPTDLETLLHPVIEQSQLLQKAFSSSNSIPFITVFLDEINTSSCLGFLKEIIVDRSLHGEPIPLNIFIVAACNPHRGNSLAFNQSWVRGTYYVSPLHPTLQLLKWDYGSLDVYQERDYIRAKMEIVSRTASQVEAEENMADESILSDPDVEIENVTMDEVEVEILVNLILSSQSKMREFACKQMKENLESSDFKSLELAEKSSRSCVSQRDIQRVFTFYNWLSKMYVKYWPHGNRSDYQRRAVLVALGLVYYMRLDAKFRHEYSEFLDDNHCSPNELSFSQALKDELDYYIQQVELPKGIAPTLALKENIFATILCTMTHTPLIIVGAPGSSKTLSFNLTVANFKGQRSKKLLFRDAKIFCSLDPHYYQCSRRTTSNEIQTVFTHAIDRQRNHRQFNIYSVVFMDEAGLPEESHESLKVLHPYLDKQEVSFVAITNHILDAAKTNRAVSLYRPEASNEDLEALVKAYLCLEPAVFSEIDVQTVIKMCQPYFDYMKSQDFSSFFGLRDFMQFVSYIQRSCDKNEGILPQLVLQALERNFNGTEDFENLCEKFFEAIGTPFVKIQHHRRQIIEILLESLQETPLANTRNNLTENEVRYKLIIDPSEDGSLIRALFSVHVMDRKNTRLFVCSDFPEDSQVQKINTIAAIRHSATKGHTIVLSQTDDILESFYDLFNHRFLRIDDPQSGPRFYANIAIGAHHQPSRVDPNFQCVVVVKKSEIKFTPAPFLNRFEKYVISYHSLLDSVLHKLPPGIRSLIDGAQEKVMQFIQVVGGSKSIYGLQQHDTLYSLLLELLPPVDYTYTRLDNGQEIHQLGEDIIMYLFQRILVALRSNAKFHIPRYPVEELQEDAAHISRIIQFEAKLNVSDLLNFMTHEDVREAITEAFNFLYSLPGPGEGDEMFIKPESCMVIIFIQQMLVLFLTKRLMKLMTTEAIIIHHKQFPPFYLEQYLGSQAHFSLQDTIATYNGALKKTKMDATRSPSKLVCFTRSSTLLHTLPVQYPYAEVDQTNSSIIFEQTDKLIMQKLSNLPSHDSLQELLVNFLSCNKAEVCLLLANMEETSFKTINHVRIIIEEEESKICDQRYKLFVLLLHIPPGKFFKPSYPAIFLKGWDYTYLDTIAHGYDAEKGILDIQDWFCKCCFSEEQQNPSSSLSGEESLSHGCGGLFSLACSSKQSIMSGPPDTLSETLRHLLPQIILPLSAGGYFGSKSDDTFNSSMDVTQRSKALKKILLERKLGDRLCEMFRTYWTPKVMMEYLEAAATFSIQRESTLNITDSMQTKFNSLFTYFCIYMLVQANEDFNLDVLYGEEHNEIFLELFSTLPVPDISILSLQSSSLSNLQHSLCQLHFPFFKRIYMLIEKQVESSQDTASFKLHQLPNGNFGGTSVKNFNDKLQNLVKDLVQNLMELKQKNKFLQLVLDFMTSDVNLWHCYFKDFVNYKLSLVSLDHRNQPTQSEFAYSILSTHFRYLDEFDATHRIAELHITYQLQVAKMVTILRPLSECKHVQPAKSMPEEQMSLSLLSNFLIGTLVRSMLRAMGQPVQDSSSSPHPMEEWFWAYRDIMNLSNLKLSIYSFLCVPEESAGHISALIEAMDLMHTTFVYLQFGPSGTIDLTAIQKAQGVVEALWKSTTSQHHPSHVSRSGLEAAVNILVERNEFSFMQLQKMLDHFFSSLHPSYNSEDVMWFLKLANEQLQLCEKMNIENSVLRFYLGRILSNHAEAEQEGVGGLLKYNQHFRKLIEDVLTLNISHGDSGPYTPKFHQAAKVNSRMQQPLCHLYFSTFLGHLESTFQGRKHSELATFIKAASSMQSRLQTENEGRSVVLWLEFQAITQLLIKELALHFDPSEWYKLGDVVPHMDKIKSVLDIRDENHGKIFAMHLVNHLKSLHASSRSVSTNDELLNKIACITPISQLFKGFQRPKMKPLELPFLSKGKLSKKYRKVESVLNEIHKGSKKLCDLVSIAATFTENGHQGASDWTLLSRYKDTYNSYCAFRMLLWLAVYYNFYLQGIESPELCAMMESEEMSKYLTTKEYVTLLQSFLQPNRMHRCKTHEVDPIYQLFVPANPSQQSSSDMDLRDSLAHLIAVVLGSPPHSNHLWYHMFEPDKLHNTFMTGFMYDVKVGHDGKLYNDGVELSPEGLYGRQGYKEHAYGCEGSSTLHSQYLLLWCNFGCFCMSLLTQPDSELHIHGSIISKSLLLRDYCMKHLRALWMHIRNNLGLLEELRVLFIRTALDGFFKFFNERGSNSSASLEIGSFGGRFTDQTCVVVYENWWHDSVYQPAWRHVTQFTEQPQGDLFKRIKLVRDWSKLYPHFPSEEDLIHYTQRSGIFQQHRVLAMFAMDYQQLYCGGVLLPDLIKFYQWLHASLAYSLTHEVAASTKVGEVIERAERKHDDRIRKLYDRVKQNFNQYVTVTGGDMMTDSRTSVQVELISNSTPLLYLLSDSENQAGNCLFMVIADIIKKHNQTIKNFYSLVQSQSRVKLIMPPQPYKILLTEVDSESVIVDSLKEQHGISMYLQLIRSRYQMATRCFKLDELEEDIQLHFIAGKPIIMDPLEFSETFKFRKLSFSILDLEDTSQLRGTFEAELPSGILKNEFHSAGYHLLLEVLTALQTVVRRLIQALKEPTMEPLERMNILDFMRKVYELHDCDHVFYNLGIQSATSKSQIQCLATIPLTSAYSCFKFFFHWIDDGYYDFNDLPILMKKSINAKDIKTPVEEIDSKWDDSPAALLKALEQLVDILKDSEQDIVKCAMEQATNQPFVDYLMEKYSDMDLECKHLVKNNYISKSVMLHHYVEFRISIRRLRLKVQQEVDWCRDTKQILKWQEVVEDLWNVHFPYLKKELLGVGKYPFMEIGVISGEIDEQEASNNLESLARKYQVDDIADFLTEIEFPEYIEAFKEEDISGDVLLKADSDSLTELGVTSLDHQKKITLKFLQKLRGNTGIDDASTNKIANFLARIGLSQYTEVLQYIGVDMLMESKPEFLARLGITSPLHQMKILQLIQREVHGTPVRYSEECFSKFLKEHNLVKYEAVLKENGIDGDMILDADEKLIVGALKEVGVSALGAGKIRDKYKTYISLKE